LYGLPERKNVLGYRRETFETGMEDISVVTLALLKKFGKCMVVFFYLAIKQRSIFRLSQ